MSIVGTFIVPHPPLIVPNIGRGEEKKISLTTDSYEKVGKAIAELKPETIIISSPHAPFYYNGYYISAGDELIGDFANFGAREVSFKEKIDDELATTIGNLAEQKQIKHKLQAFPLDHGTMVPLYFIRKYYKDCNIVVLGISGQALIEHYIFGTIIKEAVEKLDRRVVYVASGDLSHKLQDYGPYGFVEEGPIYDERIMEDCKSGEFYKFFDYNEDFLEKVAQCGHRSFVMMAGALDGNDVETHFYSHEDITGVGYGILSYIPKGFNSRRKFGERYLKEHEVKISNDPYVNLAYKTINKYIKDNEILEIDTSIPQELLERKAGTFVSIHKFGQLRGCIGTILPTRNNIALEIVNNAISASTNDYRFDPITKNELPYLDINVDVLGEIEDIDSRDELDPKKYGVIVSSNGKRGLLLPDIEGVDTVDDQIKIAMRKGGITDKDDIILQRFEVVRHT